tara:strand:- start:2151 stop:2786 length:636 start_codon:yes stop_codon:yes gene_type:complete
MPNEDLAKGLSSKVILVIDDQNSMRSVVKSFFRDFGFDRVETAIDGKDGLNFLMQNAVDIVICDWQMPKISGIELLKLLRASKESATLPFLMMTSTSDVSAVKDAMDSGVSDYMIKPFKPSQLGFKVIQLLTKSKHKARKLPVNLASLNEKTEANKPESDEKDPQNNDTEANASVSVDEAAVSPEAENKTEESKKKNDDFDGEPVEVETML